MACTCTEGEKKSAGDECNTCICTSVGIWACTHNDCDDWCPPGQNNEFGCPSVSTWFAKHPVSGKCCKYQHLCAHPDGWETFNSEAACLKEDG
jgi:hypothetical protein